MAQKRSISDAASAVRFDIETAKKMTDDFSFTCDMRCRLYDANGNMLYEQNGGKANYPFCEKLSEISDFNLDCETLHKNAISESRRFGGRYIYSCKIGMAFIAAPIIIGGVVNGALIGGPVRIDDVEDILSLDAMSPMSDYAELIRRMEDDVPTFGPRRLRHISNQLFADATFISDGSYDIFLSQRENDRQNSIGEYIAHLKHTADSEVPQYPLETETNLYHAVANGERETANRLMNEILGFIYFHGYTVEVTRTRIVEIMVIISRAAIEGGANVNQILDVSEEMLHDIRTINTLGEMTSWLADGLNRFLGFVFGMMDIKHTKGINSARSYINANYAHKITLEDVAEHIGYSPTYFSRIFKDEVGMPFKDYLNSVRIEKSRVMLLSSPFTVSEIANMCGYNDQSYFCKIFKHYTGTTPDKYRKRVRRVDTGKEHGED